MSKSSKKPVMLILVFAEWCPHCQMFKPEWQKIKMEAPKIGFDTYEINDDQLPSAAKEIRELVEGFPTLLLRHNDKYNIYTGGRSSGEVTNYVSAVMNGGGKRGSRGATSQKKAPKAQRGGMCPCMATSGGGQAAKKNSSASRSKASRSTKK